MNLYGNKHLRIYHQTTIMFAMMLLASCSSRTLEGQITATANFIEPRSPTIPSSSAQIEFPIREPTVLPSENTHGAPMFANPSPTTQGTNLPPEPILLFQPFEIRSGAPQAMKPIGALALCGDSIISILRFIPEVKVETVVENASDPLCYPTSPDGKWIAYEEDCKESPTGSWLVVQSTDGQQRKVPIDPNWENFIDYAWLDNQHLVFNDLKNPPDIQRTLAHPAYPVVVFNPFTGEQTGLPSDYPELKLGINGPAGRLSFNYSDVVYNPSLDLVIFPVWGGIRNYFVLWDRRSKAVVAKVEDQSGGFGDYPLWSPDANQFAVPVVKADDGSHAIEEWYSVSQIGEVEQLTHFSDYFSDSEISFAAWSPNGQKLAFWLHVFPSSCPNLSLAILDMATKKVTDTCLPGASRLAPPPSWSLDSQYIVIRNYGASPARTILVDSEKGQAFDITPLIGDSYPTGWLH